MDYCKGEGMYGDICRGQGVCLLGKEWDRGETSLPTEYFEQNNCPTEIINEVKAVWQKRAEEQAIIQKKIEECGE